MDFLAEGQTTGLPHRFLKGPEVGPFDCLSEGNSLVCPSLITFISPMLPSPASWAPFRFLFDSSVRTLLDLMPFLTTSKEIPRRSCGPPSSCTVISLLGVNIFNCYPLQQPKLTPSIWGANIQTNLNIITAVAFLAKRSQSSLSYCISILRG